MFQSHCSGRWMAIVSTLALLMGAGCANQNGGSNANSSLYQRLGEEAGIKKVVDSFIPIASADTKLNFLRKGTPGEFNPTPENMDKLEKNLVAYFCSVAGGPQQYDGKDMKTAHANMQITGEEFDRFEADLVTAMYQNNVSDADQNDLLGIIQSTRKDIVQPQK